MIKVDEKFYIQADTYCYQILKKGGKDKEGNDVYRVMSYPHSLARAIELIMQYKQNDFVKASDVSLDDALIQMRLIQKEMQDILNNVEKLERVENVNE